MVLGMSGWNLNILRILSGVFYEVLRMLCISLLGETTFVKLAFLAYLEYILFVLGLKSMQTLNSVIQFCPLLV